MTIQKSRGNSFEYHIVTQLRNLGFKANRMGGTTIGFPDVVATRHYTVLAIEAKSTGEMSTIVPIDEIKRCFSLLEMFDIYRNKHAIVAFKFMTKINRSSLRRPIKYYYFAMDEYKHTLSDYYKYLKCNYNGELRFVKDRQESARLHLPHVTFNKDDIFFDFKWMAQKKIIV